MTFLETMERATLEEKELKIGSLVVALVAWADKCGTTLQACTDRYAAEFGIEPATVDMVLPCPACGKLHVDAPEPNEGWTNPAHKSHLCHGCGTVWRPADFATNGVAAVATRGTADSWPTPEASE